MYSTDPHALLDLAVRAAQAAGALLVDRFHRPASGVELKSSQTDPVSNADHDAEALITGLLHEERPGDSVLGEEGAGTTGASGLGWVVDPLDGTVNFLYSIPQWRSRSPAATATGRSSPWCTTRFTARISPPYAAKARTATDTPCGW